MDERASPRLRMAEHKVEMLTDAIQRVLSNRQRLPGMGYRISEWDMEHLRFALHEPDKYTYRRSEGAIDTEHWTP